MRQRARSGRPALRVDALGAALAALASVVGLARPAAADATLDVLTYNVAGLPDAISHSTPSVNHPLISPLLDAYDLVEVQEDFAYHDKLVSALDFSYQSVRDRTPGEAGRQLGYAFGDGLNTFSRLPFTDFARVTWDECFGLLTDGGDCLTPKGFSFQRHEVAPGIFLDVYDWHGDAGHAPGDEAARRSNVRQLGRYVLQHSAGNAVLVLGDTNSRYTGDGDVLPELLAATGLRDVWIDLERGGALPPLGRSLKRGCAAAPAGPDCERVDKILYRSGARLRLEPVAYDVPDVRFRDAAGEPLSDHAPVSARFALRVAPRPGTALLLAAGLVALGGPAIVDAAHDPRAGGGDRVHPVERVEPTPGSAPAPGLVVARDRRPGGA